jgi:hypothetical protein
MDILDESVGSTNWQRYHEVVNGNLYCTVSIWDEAKGQWVSKSDCGVESNTEKEKGEASDAFKRACVNWGIGRELYTAPKDMLISCELDEKKKPKDKKLKFYVSHIEYEGTKITELTIVNQDGESLYNFPKKGTSKPPQNTPKTPPKTNETAKVVETITRSELIQKYGVSNPEKTITWLEGYFGKEIGKLTEEETKEARAILDEKKRQKEEEKRQSRLQRLDDEDIPFPMGDK